MTDTNPLPPLPEPEGVIVVGTQALRAFTAYQMRTYALQAIALRPVQVPMTDDVVRDAERYRWLLKQAWFQQAADRFDFTDGGMQARFEKCMDDFIDAAMIAAPAQKGGE